MLRSQSRYIRSEILARRWYSVPSVKLAPSGDQMPLVGFGTWKVPKDVCADTVYNAIKSGYRLIDGAQDYGNEKECGLGVKRALDEGIVKRDDIFITSKLWNTFHDPVHVKETCARSLEDWGLDHFDLFLIHFPISQKYVSPQVRYPPGLLYEKTMEFDNVPLHLTWSAMEDLVGKQTKNIGVSNFNGGLLNDLLGYSRIAPAVLQIEHHPYLTQERLVEFCKRKEIAITAYSTFGPQSFVELKNPKVDRAVSLFQHDLIKELASKYEKPVGAILLRWVVQREIAIIPKSLKIERMEENLDIFDFALEDADMKKISQLDLGLRFNDPYEWPGKIPIFA